jgi:FAD:protein FMN transferase
MKRRDFVSMAGAWLCSLLPAPRSVLRASRSVPKDRFVERWSWAMGQAVHVMVYVESEDAGLEACARALAELRRVEDRLTLFADTSDLCELNRQAGRRALRVAPDLRDILGAAEAFRIRTAGAFDPAVEPLMRAWGFHRPRQPVPSAAEIAEARAAVSAAVVRIQGDIVSLPNAHTQLDFGGIGVGYGIDRAVAVLRDCGVRRAFVDVSGDCYGLGAPPEEPEGWLVGVAGSSRTVRLRDAALATSANSESCHVMNPATGYPVDRQRQATIVARTAIEADALSTAALVSGQGSTSHPFRS